MVQSGKRYKIRNVKGGSVVDLDSNTKTKIQGWSYHGGTNQLWDFMQHDAKTWYIKSAMTGGYLAVKDNQVRDDNDVTLWKDPFPWVLSRDQHDADVWRISTPGSPFDLDLNDRGNPNDGTPIKIWGSWEGRNQCWRIEEP